MANYRYMMHDVAGGYTDFEAHSMRISITQLPALCTYRLVLTSTSGATSYYSISSVGSYSFSNCKGISIEINPSYNDSYSPGTILCSIYAYTSSNATGTVLGQANETIIVNTLSNPDYAADDVGSDGNDTLNGTPDANRLIGLDGDDQLNGSLGADTMNGGNGTDWVSYQSSNAAVSVVLGVSASGGHAQGDTLIGIENLMGSGFNDVLTGDANANRLDGLAGNDTLTGGGGNDVLVGDGAGQVGDDIIDGGIGADEMTGRGGNDIYYVDNAGDIVNEETGEGSDTVRTTLTSYTLAANVETLQFVGSGVFTGHGNASANIITGGSSGNTLYGEGGDDTLNGGTTADVLIGGAGADTLNGGGGLDVADYGASSAAVQIAVGGSGSGGDAAGDTLISVEGIYGSTYDDTLTGDDDANVLKGGGGNDVIYGRGGADHLEGGAGADLVYGEAGDDYLDGGDGDDLLSSDTGNDELIGGDGNDQLIAGWDGVKILRGGAGDDDINIGMPGGSIGAGSLVDGGDGDDFVVVSGVIAGSFDGGSGDADVLWLINAGFGPGSGTASFAGFESIEPDSDVYGSESGDVLDLRGLVAASLEASSLGIYGGGGADTVHGGREADSIEGGADNDVLDGGGGDDEIYGDGGTNTLIGGDGNDTLHAHGVRDSADGGAGDDVVWLDSPSVANVVGGTIDGGDGTNDELLFSTVFFDATSGSASFLGFEQVSGALYATGPGSHLDLSGLTAAGLASSTLQISGDEGNDTVIGGAEKDQAYGDEGNDSLSGGGGDDTLTGAGGDDIVEGGAGDDVLDGGNGVDTASYAGASAGVTARIGLTSIQNTGGAGSDKLLNFENLIGSAFADTLLGNSLSNHLDGGAGADSMQGGNGDDFYVVDNAGDVVVEADGAGSDTIDSSVTYSLAGQYVEVLNLTGTAAINGTGNSLANRIVGNAAANILVGGDGSDRLDGGAGADTMKGGLGNDVYVVDQAGDLIVENNGEGTDTVEASFSYSVAGQYIEILKLMGTDNINGTGNGLANTLYGNSGNNTLNGGTGADDLYGGAGDDIYIVDDAGDRVFENSGEGNDTVMSSVSFAIGGQYVETVTLTGSATINATGNSQANTLNGNSASNVLNGGGGDDALHGGLGSDTLTGGTGLDSYWFETSLGAGNVDTITDFSVADDTIVLDRTIFAGIAADGALDPSAFFQGTAANDADDRIVYDNVTGKLYYDADGSGAGAAVLFAQVTANTALTAADFLAVP